MLALNFKHPDHYKCSIRVYFWTPISINSLRKAMAHFSVVFSQYLQSNILNRNSDGRYQMQKFIQVSMSHVSEYTIILFHISGMYSSCLVEGNMCGYELFSVMSAIIYHGSTRFLQKIKPEHFPDERSYYLRMLYSKTI